MALSSKISTIYIRAIVESDGSDWEYTIKTKDFTSELGQANFSSAFDEAIDGSLRSNLRGYRVNVSLNWDKLYNAEFDGNAESTGDTVGGFLDDLYSEFFTDQEDYIEMSFDNTNYFKVIPENINYRTAYRNQIGRGSANMQFIGQEILTAIPAYLEAP